MISDWLAITQEWVSPAQLCSGCVCANDILDPLKLPVPELPSGEPGSLSYSQLDEQQFSRGEHSKLKPLPQGRYICWLFNPNLKSEVHIILLFPRQLCSSAASKIQYDGHLSHSPVPQACLPMFYWRWCLSTAGFAACFPSLTLFCTALTTALEMARRNE